MPVHQYCGCGVSFDLDIDEGRAVFALDDLQFHPLDLLLLDPPSGQVDGRVHMAVLFPIWIEKRGLVRDSNVSIKGGKDGIVPTVFYVTADLVSIHRIAEDSIPDSRRPGIDPFIP